MNNKGEILVSTAVLIGWFGFVLGGALVTISKEAKKETPKVHRRYTISDLKK